MNCGRTLVIVLLLAMVCLSTQHSKKLKTFAKWKEMEFRFPSKYLSAAAVKSGAYVRGNSFPIDIDIYYKDLKNPTVFISIPRFEKGIPVTLGYVTTRQGRSGLKLQPYPDYTWHSSNGTNCNGITSVVRIAIDECNRLWVIDTGRIDFYQACPPQILVFDLKTDQLMHRYKVPETQFKYGKSLLATPIVDVRDSPDGSCKETMVYIADIEAYGLVAYDFSCDKSWRFENRLMNPVPKFENITISGESFQSTDGILGMTISPKHIPQNKRLLYFHALASVTENIVPLKILNNKRNSNSSYDLDNRPNSFKKIGSRRVQSAAEAMDRNGNLFFGLTNPNAIVCWDSSTSYKKSNFKIVALSENKLQFAAGIKIITNSRGKDELWILTNRFQKYASGTMTTSVVNFRILTILLEEILEGKNCTGLPMENV